MESVEKKTYKYVSYAWDEAKAKALGNDEVALLIYRSNLLGSDLRLTNYAGGNTSTKVIEKDPLTGEATEVMWVKGSGGDLGTLKKSGLAALYMEKLMNLQKVYKGEKHEDEMVALFNHCIFDLDSKAPSIDTPLHAFLPFKHIDHLHPDAWISIATAKDGKEITKQLTNDTFAWVPWRRPGFELGLELQRAVENKPNIKGVVLGGHGLFTWGNTAYESYVNTLDAIEMASDYLNQNYGKKRPVFGGVKLQSLPKEERLNQAAAIIPTLRGLASQQSRMIGHFTDDERVLEYINSKDLEKLAPLGTSCPDHFLRTKRIPLVLDIDAKADVSSPEVAAKLEKQFEAYRKDYTAYHQKCKRDNSPAVRDANPVIILYPGVGMFSFAKDKQTTRVSSEFYINAINVIKGAEAISSYVGLDDQEAFDIEYWLLEEAKLQRMPKEKSLSRKVAYVTGASGGIGNAIAKKLAEEGACVVMVDMDVNALKEAKDNFDKLFGKDNSITTVMDVTNQQAIEDSIKTTNLAYGGVDIVVNCAGISISKSILDTTEKDWDALMDILAKGQFFVSQKAVSVLKKQKLGGDIVNVVSKNALFAGPNNAAYGTAKAAQLHLSRLMAAELGPDKIRVNVVNPDAVIRGSKIWGSGWGEGRAKAYGIKVEELPAFYAKRTLLNEEILAEDIANGVYAFVGGLLNKSTGNVLNVDGGVAATFVR